MVQRRLCATIALAAILAWAGSAQAGLWDIPQGDLDKIQDLQAVDANGNPTHPKVSAPPTINPSPGNLGPFPEDPSRATVQGIVLNSPLEFSIIDPSIPGWQYWQIYVQSEDPGSPGGIAVFQGRSWVQSWPPPYPEVNPGDRVRVNGFLLDYWGKTNMNSRHSGAAVMDFIVELDPTDPHPGMPAPVAIPNVAACNTFSGGETYQTQWCKLTDVWIVDPPTDDPPWGNGWGWGAGKSLLVTDASGATLPVYLSESGDFDQYFAPNGTFDVVGLFDQEDPGTDIGGGITAYTDNYRLWALHTSDFTTGLQVIPEPASLSLLALGAVALAARRRSR